MRLIPSDPDVETVVRRIADGSLDLQPDFQRGEVWSRPKQRLLIDSILRMWYVPPVHVIRTPDDEQEVLDGQQRLRAIYEFTTGHFTVDGAAEPKSTAIEQLDGLRYADLPPQVRRRFDRFTLRVFEIVDYEPEEPYELFYRLNQPTTLTSAEKRNAFFGPAREQIRELTTSAERAGMESGRVGFSNTRLGYEDIVARFVWTLNVGTLREKLTANKITERYRDSDGFGADVLNWAKLSLDHFFSIQALDSGNIRLNKATTHSWLCFVARGELISLPIRDTLSEFVTRIEQARTRTRQPDYVPAVSRRYEMLIPVFHDRATARVNDVSSVLLRDAILWILYASDFPAEHIVGLDRLTTVVDDVSAPAQAELELLRVIESTAWGSLT